MHPLANKAPHRSPMRFGPPAHERMRAQRRCVGIGLQCARSLIRPLIAPRCVSARPLTNARARSVIGSGCVKTCPSLMSPIVARCVLARPPTNARARSVTASGLCQNVSFLNGPPSIPRVFRSVRPRTHGRAALLRRDRAKMRPSLKPPINLRCVLARPPTNAHARSVAASWLCQNVTILNKAPHRSPICFSPPAHERARAQRRCVGVGPECGPH
ncbi:hypothetical protein B0H19DRAFT_174480 [Mycena capillaripes]|nr:hypothetical protein B0H19DRAFT_174480 [Mycena capillaripes]